MSYLEKNDFTLCHSSLITSAIILKKNSPIITPKIMIISAKMTEKTEDIIC